MSYQYDPDNIFAKILRGEIPNDTVSETEHTLAFRDIRPQAPVHVLVIPKGSYVNYHHFASEATDAEILDYTRTIGALCETLGLVPEGNAAGFRTISNTGNDGVQDVPHLHTHLLGGRVLGPMLPHR